MSRPRLVFGITLGGLAVLAVGLADAQPIVFAYTDAEYAKVERGRAVMAMGTALLAGAAGMLAGDGRRVPAAAVAAPGLVCTGLAFALPPYRGGLALVLFVPLAIAAVVAARPRERRPPA